MRPLVLLRKARAAWGKYMRRRRDTTSIGGRSTEDIDRQLKKVKAAFLEHMADYRNAVGVVELPPNPMLEEKHLENCRMLPHREALLQQMKVGGIVAEVGVETGRFSKSIM